MTNVRSQSQGYDVKHLAVIMDGKRRWAKQRGLPSIEGHRAGVQALKKLVRSCDDYAIEYLTVYAFSTENWKRSEEEVGFLFKLLSEVAIRELAELKDTNVKVNYIGDLSLFQAGIRDSLLKLEEQTKANTGLKLQIALNYGSVDELTRAAYQIREKLDEEQVNNLSEEDFASYLYTRDCPDPDLLIRTGGEQRLSNYLLWQCARSRLSFIDTLWPDFNTQVLGEVLSGSSKITDDSTLPQRCLAGN